jgi:hypothetical protein
MTNLFGPGLGACYAIPSQTSDAGPADPVDTRDSADWLFEARWQTKLVDRIDDDAVLTDRDPLETRNAKLEAIDLAIDALRCARELVEIEKSC